jgi:hypothetical protein
MGRGGMPDSRMPREPEVDQDDPQVGPPPHHLPWRVGKARAEVRNMSLPP